MDLNKISLNTATVRAQWDLKEIIEACLRHNICAIAPWRDQIHEIGLKKISKMIRDSQLKVSSLCRGGMFPQKNKILFKKNIEDNLLAIDEAKSINADCLVLVVGGIPEDSCDIEGARKQVLEGILNILDYAKKNKMPLGIEPLHPMYAADRACINTIKQALNICNKINDDFLGIVLDVYHIWWDPDLEESIQKTKGKILGYHVCDWHRDTNDILLDRGMMGDGIVDIKKISNWISKAGYDNLVEVEIFSKNIWWSKPGDEVIQIVKNRFLEYV